MITTLNCNGTVLDLSQPIIMGILNVTPDSFYDGGKYLGVDAAVQQAKEMSVVRKHNPLTRGYLPILGAKESRLASSR